MNTQTKRVIKIAGLRLGLLVAGLALLVIPFVTVPLTADQVAPLTALIFNLLRNALGLGLIIVALTPKASTLLDILGWDK